MPESDSLTLLTILLSLGLILVAGLAAAIEATLVTLSRSEITELAESARSRKALLKIAENKQGHTDAVTFVRILAETSAVVLAAIFSFMVIENHWLAFAVATAGSALALFLIVGVLARNLGYSWPKPVLKWSARIARTAKVWLGPLANLLVVSVSKVAPSSTEGHGSSSEEQILQIVDEAFDQDLLEDEDHELIHSVFEFGDTVVREVMIPRTDMITIDTGTPLARALEVFLSSAISRIPVIGKDMDDVRGLLVLRDVVKVSSRSPERFESETVDALLRQPLFVPESKKASDTLGQMRRESSHFAIVVDEYGGTAGLVTMEDIIEELVGDIEDEYDTAAPEVELLVDGSFRVSSRLPLDEVGELFDLELDDEDVESVGGLVAKVLGRIPEQGAEIEYQGLKLAVEELIKSSRRRGQTFTVLVEKVPQGEPSNTAEEKAGEGHAELS